MAEEIIWVVIIIGVIWWTMTGGGNSTNKNRKYKKPKKRPDNNGQERTSKYNVDSRTDRNTVDDSGIKTDEYGQFQDKN